MITQEKAISLLDYDPITGLFSWRRNGKRAGTVDANGYVIIGVEYGDYKAHRLAWLIMTGEWPSKQIDHIDRVKTNNAWNNLRQVKPTQNQLNSSLRSNNTSGVKGVHFHKPTAKWLAKCAGAHIGLYDSKEEASKAYRTASTNLFNRA